MKAERRHIPLYFQLEQIIRSKIVIGEFAPGSRIPTEKEFAEAYQVSTITARQAVLNLVREGLLARKQGKGTYVLEGIGGNNTLQLKGTIEDVIKGSLKPKEVKVLEIVKTKCPNRIADILHIDRGEEVFRFKRIRSHSGSPISYVINYIPCPLGERIRRRDLVRYPMLQILKDQLKVPMRTGKQFIEAIAADHEVASALSIHISSPVLYAETIIFTDKNKPVEYVQNFIRPDRFKYSVGLFLTNSSNKVRLSL